MRPALSAACHLPAMRRLNCRQLLPCFIAAALAMYTGTQSVDAVTTDSQFVFPEFEALPPHVTYTKPNVPVTLLCRAKGARSVVQCGFRRGQGDEEIRFVPTDSVVTSGVRCLRGGAILVDPSLSPAGELRRLEFFCKAVSASNFAIISAPFRVQVAGIEPYTRSTLLITKQCFKGNKVQIECEPPASVPPAQIVFTANGAPLNPLGKSTLTDEVVLDAVGAIVEIS